MQVVKDTMRAPVNRHMLWLIVLITMLGFAVRVINLGGDSLWFDEILTSNAARRPIESILADRAPDRPPGYYALEHYAAQWWGVDEFGVRLTSALAGTLAIPLAYVTGGLIAKRRVGLWVALLLAVSPFHLRYSQEARGYAIQTMFALAALACILLALRRRQWRWWIGFGMMSSLNLYNLFGALLVIGSQAAFVLALTLVQALRRVWTRREIRFALSGLLLAGALAVLLYAPYMGSALQGVQANLGPDARQSSWYGVPLADWISSALQSFSYENSVVAIVMGVVALSGLIATIVRRNVAAVLWLIIGSLSPLLVITFIGVSRAPLAKYVLFVLPVFLLAVAIGLEEIVEWITARVRRPLMRYAPLAVGLCLVLVSLPAITAEHAYAAEDWRDILAYVQRTGSEGDVFVPITLDLTDGFNQGISGLEQYLPQYFAQYLLLPGEHLANAPAADLDRAAQSNGNVWVTLYQRRHPIRLDDPRIEVTPFQTAFYLVRLPNTDRSALEELADAYPQIIAQANTPAPQCYLWIDLAWLKVQLGRYDEAYQAMTNMPKLCPESLDMRQSVYRQLLDHAVKAGQTDRARDIARQLLVIDAKDAAALQAVTIYDLENLHTTSTPAEVQGLSGVLMDAQPSPAKPIETQRFTMPDNGDWGEALVMQTPARVSYRLQLPNDQTMFVSRIAMAPESWTWGGDGARFEIHVADETGQTSTVFDQLVTNQPADQMWHDVRVPLTAFAGKTITLTLETDPGPQGDTTGDWAGWETPRITYAAATDQPAQ
jgi:4-amino-4-deoxy-L-arabinose transferase-like glycosyltransferase